MVENTVVPKLVTPESKLVYLYIESTGRATLDEIERGLRLKKLTLFPILLVLLREGVVQKRGEYYMTFNH